MRVFPLSLLALSAAVAANAQSVEIPYETVGIACHVDGECREFALPVDPVPLETCELMLGYNMLRAEVSFANHPATAGRVTMQRVFCRAVGEAL